jgi:protein-disulfide isomerase
MSFGCGGDDGPPPKDERLDTILENQEQIIKLLQGTRTAIRSLVDKGLSVDLQPTKPGMPAKGSLAADAAKNAPRKGPESAQVTVMEFADFGCPFCMRLSGLSSEIVAAHEGDVAFVFKHFPLAKHEGARLAGQAAWAAGQQGKFWEMHDQIFASQGKISEKDLFAHASAIGLDMERFQQDLRSPPAKDAVTRDKRQGRAAGVRTTPAFFINGVRVQGSSPEGLRRAIAGALAAKGPEGAQAGAAAAAGDENL